MPILEISFRHQRWCKLIRFHIFSVAGAEVIWCCSCYSTNVDADGGLCMFRSDPDKGELAAPPFEEVRSISVIKL